MDKISVIRMDWIEEGNLLVNAGTNLVTSFPNNLPALFISAGVAFAFIFIFARAAMSADWEPARRLTRSLTEASRSQVSSSRQSYDRQCSGREP